MAIEERINAIIEFWNTDPQFKKIGWIKLNWIQHWSWHGKPGPYAGGNVGPNGTKVPNSTVPALIDSRIFAEILLATTSECLQAQSEYVREAKWWSLMNQDELRKVPA